MQVLVLLGLSGLSIIILKLTMTAMLCPTSPFQSLPLPVCFFVFIFYAWLNVTFYYLLTPSHVEQEDVGMGRL